MPLPLMPCSTRKSATRDDEFSLIPALGFRERAEGLETKILTGSPLMCRTKVGSAGRQPTIKPQAISAVLALCLAAGM